MPIWFELLVMLLVTYAIGFGIGWALFGRDIIEQESDHND